MKTAAPSSPPRQLQSQEHLDVATPLNCPHFQSHWTLQQLRDKEGGDEEAQTQPMPGQMHETIDVPFKDTPRTTSVSSPSSPLSTALRPRHPRAKNPLRGDTNLKIFLPSDNLALKAILSPLNHTVSARVNDKDIAMCGSSPNLLDKLLFRTGNQPPTVAMTPKMSMESVVEEDVEAMNIVVMNSNLPPPPFANMYACESCRDDIGSLLSKGRHHCRNCGGSFCADCSAKSIVVPYQAYLTRGELRVCDGCFNQIQNFHKQVKSTSVTWSGLQPPSSEQIVRDFDLSVDENPVAIFNCALFVEMTPLYGHLVFTRKRLCFQSYAESKKRQVAYSQVLSLLKPQFYYINGLQVKTKRKDTFFLAEFNGLRDTCFLRLDQLLRAYQETSKLKAFGPGNSPSFKELRRQALDRRRSYKLISEHVSSVGCAGNPSSPLLSSSSPISTVGFIDVDDENYNADVFSNIMVDGGHIDDDKSTASDEEPFEPLPPDPLLEKMTVLLDCDLHADVKRVFDLLWNDGPGQEFSYANMEKARDIDIDIESWKAIDKKNDPVKAEEVQKGFEISKEDDYTLYRNVRFQHPPKISFPGLPSYAGCTRTQRFRLDKSSNGGNKWDRFVVTELNRMSKIPFSDYFEVEMRYVFSRDGNNYCHVQVGLVVNFLKATWFKSQINSSVRSESKEALESWTKQSIEFLESQRNRIVPPSPRCRKLSTSDSFSELESESGSAFRSVPKRRALGARPTSTHLKSVDAPATVLQSSCTGETSARRHVWLPPSLVQLLLLGVLFYGLLLLHGHVTQIQRLSNATTKLLEHLQEQQSMMQTQALRMQQKCEDPSVKTPQPLATE